MSLEITTLQEKHLEDAAALVSARFMSLRQRVPVLPRRYEQTQAILPMLSRLGEKSPGVVAIQSGRLVGFLVGMVIPMLLGKRTAYSPEWANGADLEDSRRIYGEMYARLSARWVGDGCLAHAVTMLANDEQGIEGWQWMGFGLAGVDGVRELEPVGSGGFKSQMLNVKFQSARELERVKGAGAQIEVRQAGRAEAATAAFFIKALEQYMAAPPIFWIHELEGVEEYLDDPGKALWQAYDGPDAVGCMAIGPANPDACAIVEDDKTASIMAAFTLETARGQGVATALLNRCLEWARARGCERCAVDYETMNMLAARFWPKWFQTVCYSLIRCIDERVANAQKAD